MSMSLAVDLLPNKEDLGRPKPGSNFWIGFWIGCPAVSPHCLPGVLGAVHRGCRSDGYE